MKEGSDTDIQRLKIHAKSKKKVDGFAIWVLVAVVMTRAPRDSRNCGNQTPPTNLLILNSQPTAYY